jgi:hypothetical protein
MKRSVPLLLFACCFTTVQAGYDDGLISLGEYEWFAEWLSGTLIVDGGGVLVLEARNSSRVEVWSTTPFLPLPHQSGITDLAITNTSRLDYYGGETEELTVQKNAEAHLRGGRIIGITSMQFVTWVNGQPRGQHIFIHARDGWEWKYENGVIRGITGLWRDDGSSFDIRLINHPDFDPAWANIKVIPEPASLMLLGIGALLLRRRH